MTIGIYCIVNKKTGQKYIGQSINLEKREKTHFWKLKKNIHPNQPLQNSWNKYGETNFSFETLERIQDSPFVQKILDNREKFYIKKFDTYKNKKHYNLTPGGDFNPSRLPEIQKKLSENHADFRGENNPMFGKKHCEESKRKMSENHVDCNGKNNPMFGKKHKKATKKKMSMKKNSSGVFHVGKQVSNKTKQGFVWIYTKPDRNKISCVDLIKLKEKVLSNNYEWEVIDEKKLKILCEEHGYNFDRLL